MTGFTRPKRNRQRHYRHRLQRPAAVNPRVAHVAHVASFQQKVVMYQGPSVRGLVAHKAAHSWHTWHTRGLCKEKVCKTKTYDVCHFVNCGGTHQKCCHTPCQRNRRVPMATPATKNGIATRSKPNATGKNQPRSVNPMTRITNHLSMTIVPDFFSVNL